MSSSERNRLLNDTLWESVEYETFRELVFKQGQAELRKKRATARFSIQWAVAASILFGIALGLWGITRKNQPPAVAHASSVDSFVSRPLDVASVVHSATDDRLFVQTPAGKNTQEIVTPNRVPLIELNDRELLAVFREKAAGFVQNNGHLEFMVLEN